MQYNTQQDSGRSAPQDAVDTVFQWLYRALKDVEERQNAADAQCDQALAVAQRQRREEYERTQTWFKCELERLRFALDEQRVRERCEKEREEAHQFEVSKLHEEIRALKARGGKPEGQ